MAKTRDEIEVLMRMRAEGMEAFKSASDTLRTMGVNADRLADELTRATKAQQTAASTSRSTATSGAAAKRDADATAAAVDNMADQYDKAAAAVKRLQEAKARRAAEADAELTSVWSQHTNDKLVGQSAARDAAAAAAAIRDMEDATAALTATLGRQDKALDEAADSMDRLGREAQETAAQQSRAGAVRGPDGRFLPRGSSASGASIGGAGLAGAALGAGLGDALRDAAGGADDLANRMRETDRAQQDAQRSSELLNEVLGRMGGGLTTLVQRVGTVIAGYMALEQAWQAVVVGMGDARALERGLANVSTLIEGTAQQMDFLRERSSAMAREFGTTSAAQVEGFYEILSAGVDDLGKANEIMDVANRLAVGGASNTATAMDLLTTSVNAYANTGLSAAKASDILFVATALGKTNMDELGHSLGGLLPIANQMGVSFEEAAMSVAALTTVGIDTSSAVSGIRQALVSTLRPTDDAKEAAREFGLEFSAAAVEAKGFQAFLEDVIDKTGGSVEKIGRLYTDVDGLKAVLALAGGAGDQFAKGMRDVEDALGKTDEAFAKVAAGKDFKIRQQVAELRLVMEQLGGYALTVLVPALQVANGAVDLLADALPVLTGALLGLAARGIPAAVTAMGAWITANLTGASTATMAAAAARSLNVALGALGGGLGLLLTVGGGLAGYFLSSRSGVDGMTQATTDLNAATTALRSTQEAMEADTRALTDAREEYAQAMRNGSDAERMATSAELDNIQRRLQGNDLIINQLKEVQRLKLEDMRIARDAARDEYAKAATAAFTEMYVDDGLNRGQAEAKTIDRLNTTENEDEVIALLGGAVQEYVAARREMAEAAGEVFTIESLTPAMQAAWRQMGTTGEAFGRASAQVKSAEQSVAGLDATTTSLIPNLRELVGGVQDLGTEAETASKDWSELVKKFGGAQTEIAELERSLVTAQRQLAAARSTPGSADDTEAARIVTQLQEAIREATDAETRFRALEAQFAALNAVSERFGLDKDASTRNAMEEMKRLLDEARGKVGELNNADLSKLENALSVINAGMTTVPSMLQNAAGWVDNRLGTDLSGMINGGWAATMGTAVQGIKDAAELAERGILELIAKPESGGDYNARWGGNEYTSVRAPVSSLTLRELFNMQKEMLRNPANEANSSAAGRYQIVGTTLFGKHFDPSKGEGLFDKLGLKWDDVFDERTQDRLAMELVRQVAPKGAGAMKGTWVGLQQYPDAVIDRAVSVTQSGQGEGLKYTPVDREAAKEAERRAKEAQRENERQEDAHRRAMEAYVRERAAQEEAIRLRREEKAIRDDMSARGATDAEITEALNRAEHAREQQRAADRMAWIREEATLRAQLRGQGMSAEDIDDAVAQRRLERDAAEANISMADAEAAAAGNLAVSYDEVADAKEKSLALLPAMSRALGENIVAMSDADRAAKQFTDALGGGFNDALDLLLRGEESFDSLQEVAANAFNQMGAALIKFTLQAMILEPILKRLRASMDATASGGGGGGFWSFVGNAALNLLGGGSGGGGGGGWSAPRIPSGPAAAAPLATLAAPEPLASLPQQRSAGMTLNVNPTVNVPLTYASAPGAQQQGGSRDVEQGTQLGAALTTRIKQVVTETLVDEQRNGGLLSGRR